MTRSRMVSCSCGRINPEGTTCVCRSKDRRNYSSDYQKNDKGNPLKTTRWTKLRRHILKRDNFLCQRCLHKYGLFNSNELQGHHIKSRKNFPELTFEERNIITLCKTCNLQLGTSDILDFGIPAYEVQL